MSRIVVCVLEKTILNFLCTERVMLRVSLSPPPVCTIFIFIEIYNLIRGDSVRSAFRHPDINIELHAAIKVPPGILRMSEDLKAVSAARAAQL